MSVLVIRIEIGVDPTLEDPWEVAAGIDIDGAMVGEKVKPGYDGVEATLVSAEWEPS